MIKSKIIPMIVVILLFMTGVNLLIEIPTVSGSPEPVNEDTKPPISGTGLSEFNRTWYVDTNETLYYGNQTINITGDLIINSTGTLIFYNVTLQFNCSSNNEYGIFVDTNGTFNLTDSVIKAGNNSYSFIVYGELNMNNCEIRDMYAADVGFPSEYVGGLEIYSNDVVINSSHFHQNYNNLYIHTNSGGTPEITNNIINDSLKDLSNVPRSPGMIVTDFSRPYISGNKISDQTVGISLLEDCEPVIEYNEISDGYSYGITSTSSKTDIKITNNSIARTSFDGIWFSDPSGGLIADNDIYDTDQDGIYYSSKTKSIIRKNHIYGNSRNGIFIDASTSWIFDNTIENNSQRGIFVRFFSDPDPTIENNVIQFNGVDTGLGGYGIIVESASAKITNNFIAHNGPLTTSSSAFWGGGVYIISGGTISTPRIDNNTLKWNNRNGIDIDSGSKPTLVDNIVEYSNSTGIMITDTALPEKITGNTMRYNAIGMIYDKKSTDIKFNDFIGNLDYGLHLKSGSSPTVSLNVFSQNGDGEVGDAAIFLDGSAGAANAKIYDNDISNNSGSAIKIKNSVPRIEKNIINYNIDGLFFDACSGNVIGNHIYYNTENGIRAEKEGADPVIEQNTIDHNKIGIGVYTKSEPMIKNNWLRYNEIGAKITGFSWPKLESLNINSNQKGLRIEYSLIKMKQVNLNGNTQIGIDVKGTNFTIENCSISNSGITELALNDNSHVTLMNTTFNKNKVQITDTKSELIVKWFLDVIVVDKSDSPLSGAKIRITNQSGKTVWLKILTATGRASFVSLREYIETYSSREYLTPHIIAVEKNGYEKIFNEVTIDQSKTEKIIVGTNLNPTMVTFIEPKLTHTLLPKITWTAATDPDGDSITYYINIGTQKLGDDWLNSTTGVTTDTFFQLTQPLSFGDGNVTYYITVYARDGKGGESVGQSVMYAVNNQPLPPKIAISPKKPTRLAILTCAITSPSVDADNDNISYTFRWFKNGVFQEPLSSNASSENSSSIPAEFTSDLERWKCTVQAFDGYFYSPIIETEEVLIKNFKPYINSTLFSLEIPEDTVARDVFNLEYVFDDENNEDLNFEWNTHKKVKVAENNSWISFEPEENWNGEAKFKFTAKDLFDQVTMDFTLIVLSVNDLPVFDFVPALYAEEDKWFEYTFSASDYADSDKVTYFTNISEAINGLKYDNNNYEFSRTEGTLRILPDDSMIGTYVFNVSAEDANKGIAIILVNITIANLNDNPVATITSPADMAEFTVGDILVLDGSESKDDDSVHGDYIQTVEWLLDGEKIGDKLKMNYSLTKAGTFTVTLKITDSNGATSEKSITITVRKADSQDDGDGILSGITGNPTAIAGISIVIIIVIMIVLAFLFTIIRKRREKKKLVDAGILTEADLKKVKEEPTDGARGIVVGTLRVPPGGGEPSLDETSYEPGEGDEFRTGGELKVTGGEVEAAPAWGPGIELEGAEFAQEEMKKEVEISDISTIELDESAAVLDEQPTVKEAGKDEVGAIDTIELSQIICPKCGTSAQSHPSDRNAIICPVCGEQKI